MRTFATLAWLLASLVAAGLLSGGASAHAGAFETSVWLADETALVEVEGAPVPVARAPMTLKVVLPMADAPRVVTAEWTSPDGAALGVEALEPLEASTYVLPMRFSQPGDWGLRLDADGASASVVVPVHPPGDAFVAAADAMAAQSVLVAGRPQPLALAATDAAREPLRGATDVVAHVERWDEAGARLLETREVPLREAAPGVYSAQAQWDAPGVLRVRAASPSWQLAPEDRPSVDVLVVAPEDAHVYGLEAEERGVAGLALAAAASAVALAALALRRRA